jgi:hypothetical protein
MGTQAREMYVICARIVIARDDLAKTTNQNGIKRCGLVLRYTVIQIVV